MPLIDHPSGNYRFLPGIAPYSCGVVAAPNFEIVQVTLQRPLPYVAGFDVISQHLAAAGRPRASLCAIALRSPRPFTFAGFAEFNASYANILKSWGLFVDGVNPVARTNVAPAIAPPAEPVLYSFSYTSPLSGDVSDRASATFVVAGAGELPEGVLEDAGIIARGDTTPRGIQTKAAFVLDLMESRLRGLGGDWPLVSADVTPSALKIRLSQARTSIRQSMDCIVDFPLNGSAIDRTEGVLNLHAPRRPQVGNVEHDGQAIRRQTRSLHR